VVTSYRGKCVGEGDEDAGGEERPQAHHTTGGTETLGEAFPECNTLGRASGDTSHGKEVFPECQKSYTRGSLPRVPS
jgi:hypothetical protein